jgi:hypothetical protein
MFIGLHVVLYGTSVSHIPFLIHDILQNFNKSSMAGASRGAGTVYHS